MRLVLQHSKSIEETSIYQSHYFILAVPRTILMARIFITGSADGLGQLTAKTLIEQGHKVLLHARNAGRGREALKKNPGAETVVTGDLSHIEETKSLGHKVNELGTFDAVIHNAGVYQSSAKEIFAVNTLAPYILTCLIQKPKRLIYLSSGMHLQGRLKPDNFNNDINRITYSDSKLHVVMLCMAVARKWPGVYSNAVDPGWFLQRWVAAGHLLICKKDMKHRGGLL